MQHDPCALAVDNTCDVNSVCLHSGPGLYSCDCFPGWDAVDIGFGSGRSGDGSRGGACVDIDECAASAAQPPCQNGGACLHSNCLDGVAQASCPARGDGQGSSFPSHVVSPW